jgi:hypothetical protein
MQVPFKNMSDLRPKESKLHYQEIELAAFASSALTSKGGSLLESAEIM